MNKKIALVTGGSRGIGKATCKLLAQNEYHVIVHYGHSQNAAEELVSEISGDSFKANLSDDVEIKKLCDYVQNKYQHIDLLVNNAGIAECEDLSNLTKESFFETLQINLWAPCYLTKTLSPIIRDGGSIIFTSSVCAQRPTNDALAYAASKAGIDIIVKSITKELAPKIRVNAVAPSATKTDMMKKNFTDDDVQWIKKNYPMKRPCDPEDIANMVLFLASDNAKNITGQIFTVDAGSGVK